MDVIDTFLATFITYIDTGFGLLSGDVAYLTTTLIVIDITLAGLFWALSQNSDVIAGLLKKILYVGFFALVIGNFSFLTTVVFDSFARLGLVASGSGMTQDDLLRPGFIAGVGLEAGKPLLSEIGDLVGPMSFFHNFVMIAVMFAAWIVLIIAFFVLAIQLFVTILEFKLTTLCGFILVPFALWNQTSFLAERVLGHVITSGIKLMVIAVIIGIGSTLFASVTAAFRTGDDVTISQVMGTVLAALVFLWMGVFAPGLASGLITGAPQLGAGSAVGVAAAATIGSVLAGKAAVGAAPGAVLAGARVAGAAHTAYSAGYAMHGGTGPRAEAAGVQSVMRAGGGALVDAIATKPAAAIREAYTKGRHGAYDALADKPAGGNGADGQTSAGQAGGPAWAKKMQARQRVGQVGQVAAHTLRDGDRGSGGANPRLQNRDD